jgi:hypothetical protein
VSTRRWQWAAVALTLVASLTWAFAPTSSSVSTSATPGDTGQAVEVATSSEQLSLLQVEGLSVLPALLLPVAVVLVPLLVGVRYARLVALGCVVLLVLFVLAALFSIGAGYLPGLVLAVVAVARGNPGRPASAGGPAAVADAAG